MAVTIAAGVQRRSASPVMVGTATNYSETVTATGALDANIVVSIIEVLGTATTVIDTYTLGTGPYEGFEKWIFTGEPAVAADALGQVKVELAGLSTVATLDQRVMILEFPASARLTWINNNWYPVFNNALATAASISTATT